jgi:3-methyl-2-oxobutanoate hydroxymethyltransferase
VYIDCKKKHANKKYAISKGVRKIMNNTVSTIQEQKKRNDKITMLTAYDYSTAKLIDEAGVNSILVGDSLGMVMLGYKDTLSVTMEDMIHHTSAVARGSNNALIVADMPFMSYQTSAYDAVFNAGRLMKEGHAHAVKLEGGEKMSAQIKSIVDASIPVVAHIGLTPQSVYAFGGYKVQGKDEETARQLIRDAKAVEEAGAFAVVLECVPSRLAALITESIYIPTIGIGAGAGCDGQVLVYQDMLSMYGELKPKFVKSFANVGEMMTVAFKQYIEETKAGVFPGEEHTFNMADEIIEKLY